MTKPLKLALAPDRHNAQVVDQLTTMLQLAQRGEIIELIATTRTATGFYDHCWTGCENLLELVGVLERQKQATLRRMDGC